MSQLNSKKIKFGDNQDLSKNFVMYVPAVADGTFTFAREDGTVIWSIPSAGGGGGAATVNGLTVAGSLDFSGTSRRITGDFSNATQSQRLLFQTSVVNGFTNVGAIPNGTSKTVAFTMFNNPDPTNASLLQVGIETFAGTATIYSGQSGSAPFLPLVFNVGPVGERFRLPTAENRFQADFSSATLASRLMFQSSVANGVSSIAAIPNGTAANSSFIAFAASDPANATFAAIIADTPGGVCSVRADKTGSGAYLPLTFNTGGAERIRLQSNGDFSMGSNSPVAGGRYLDVNNLDPGASSFAIMRLITQQAGSASTVSVDIAKYKNGAFVIANNEPNTAAAFIAFQNSSVERMRIGGTGYIFVANNTYSGNPGIGNSNGGFTIEPESNNNGASLFVSRGGFPAAYFNTNVDGVLVQWRRSGNIVGGVSVTATASTYLTSSDYRMKKNVRAMVAPLARLLRLKPVVFDWIRDDSEGEGFLAHELQKEVPLAVFGEKDAVKQEDDIKGPKGEIIPQGVDLSKVVPLLVAAVQELAQQVAELKMALGPIGPAR